MKCAHCGSNNEEVLIVEKIKLILFDVQNNGEEFLDEARKICDFEVVCRINTLSALINAVKINNASKSSAILCIYCGANAVVAPEVLSYISTARLKSIAVCENVPQGFSLLKRGVNDMIVFDRNKSGFFFKSLASRARTIIAEAAVKRTLKNDFGVSVKLVIAIGSSTGGTESVVKILEKFPADMPPILLTQHMPPIFTNLFAKRLNGLCKMTVWEANDGDEVKNGMVLIAPGERQMALQRRGGRLVVNCTDENPVSGHCPSVDVLFSSVATTFGKNSIGVILTGMGADGAQGLLKMYQAGAYTIGQNRESCVVYGMPKVAFDIGAVGIQLHLDKIADEILAQAARVK